MDGLAGGVAVVTSVFLGQFLLAQGEHVYAVLLLSLAGACAGFLVYNFHPARIYLGDAGSQLIGFLSGCAALTWWSNEPPSLQWGLPLLILAAPLYRAALLCAIRQPFLARTAS